MNSTPIKKDAKYLSLVIVLSEYIEINYLEHNKSSIKISINLKKDVMLSFLVSLLPENIERVEYIHGDLYLDRPEIEQSLKNLFKYS